MIVGTGPADGGHDEITGLQVFHARAGLHDFAQRFVAEHQKIGAIRRGAVGEGADLAVGAADADLDGPNLEFGGRGHTRHGVLEQGDLPFRGNDTDGSHASVVHR